MRSKAAMIVKTIGRAAVIYRVLTLSKVVIVRDAAGDREVVAA